MDNTELNTGIDKFFEGYQGASDLRSEIDKEKDYSQIEFVASASPVNWVGKQLHEWRSFPTLNQFFTFKCVAFTVAKLAIINFWLKTKEIIIFSPNSIYDYRANKPEGGMIGNNAFEIWQDKGISLVAVCKSDQVKESDPVFISLFAKEVAKGFKLGNHITIPAGDFDRVASTIQITGKGVMVWFYFTSREWSREVPKIMDNLAGPYESRSSRHSVTAGDFGVPLGFVATLAEINGKQALKIEDSAHFGVISVRYITREFFNARNFLAKYPMQFNYEDPAQPTVPKPVYVKGNTVSLQNSLKHYGTFPSNIASTGFFGPITAKAVSLFQIKEGLHPTGTGTVGPLTAARLKLLYP